MNLYKISREGWIGYDEYDSAIVAAASEYEARLIHPSGDGFWEDDRWKNKSGCDDTYLLIVTWCIPSDLKVACVGTTHLPEGVVLASFNAG